MTDIIYDHVYNEFKYSSRSKLFTDGGCNLISRYIKLMYAASKTPMHTDVSLPLLFDDYTSMKAAIKIDKHVFDIFLLHFENEFNQYVSKNCKYKGRNKGQYLLDLNSTALRIISKFGPTVE